MDTGATLSMTRRKLRPEGMIDVKLADGRETRIPYGIWVERKWLLGSQNLVGLRDLDLGTDGEE